MLNLLVVHVLKHILEVVWELTFFLVCRKMDNLEDKQKYEKYVIDMTSYVTAKYFSDKTIFGGKCGCWKYFHWI